MKQECGGYNIYIYMYALEVEERAKYTPKDKNIGTKLCTQRLYFATCQGSRMSPLYRYRKPNSLIIHFIHHVYYIDIITIIIASSKHHHRIISIIIIIIVIIIIIILPNLFYRLSINAMSLGPLFFFQLLPPAATRADAVTSQIRQGLEVLYSSDRYSA